MDQNTSTAAEPQAAPAPVPFVPKPMPKSGYADPSKANPSVKLAFPVIFDGKTYDAIYLRRLTVAQVATVIDNCIEERKTDPNAELSFPIYIDAEENDLPIGVVGLLSDEEWNSIQELGRDTLPPRFRPPPRQTETENPSRSSASNPSTGEPTEE